MPARALSLKMRDFGNQKGGSGFVLYRVTSKRIALWVAAVQGGDVAWAKPLTGAVALFIFSSRRRHTRSLCDWSSDVCLPISTAKAKAFTSLATGSIAAATELQRVTARLPT